MSTINALQRYRRPPLHHHLRHVALAATLVSVAHGPALQAEDSSSTSFDFRFDQDFALEAPAPIRRGEILYLTKGFFLRMGERSLMGDALRYDQASEELYATGRVVLTQKDVRIEAEHLGLRRLPTNERGQALVAGQEVGRIPLVGEAWDAKVRVRNPQTGRIMEARAARVSIEPRKLVLTDVRATGGYGSYFGFRAKEMVIGIRKELAEDREGFKRQVEDITVWHSRIRIFDIPVFYLPVVYRDFRLNYPWTRFEAGSSKRLGRYARGWTGLNLPTADPTHHPAKRRQLEQLVNEWIIQERFKQSQLEGNNTDIAQIEALRQRMRQLQGKETAKLDDFVPKWYHWHTRAEVRGDYHQEAGEGYGAKFAWDHYNYGRGYWQWYEMPNEQVFARRGFANAFADGPGTFGRMLGSFTYAEGDSPPPIQQRSAHVTDIEHFIPFAGGALYGRWVDIPDADPWSPDVIDPARLFAPPESQPPNERFRADFLENDIDTRPLARRGLSLAYSTSTFSTVLDSEWKHHPDLYETEREFGAQLEIPQFHLFGPLHIGGHGWAEKLRRNGSEKRLIGSTWNEQEAERLNYDAYVSAQQWLWGLGVDMRSGFRGLLYNDAQSTVYRRQNDIDTTWGLWNRYYDSSSRRDRRLRDYGLIKEISHVATPEQYRLVQYNEGGLSFRAEGTFDSEHDTYSHIFTPRIGFEQISPYRGEIADWQNYNFADGGDDLEADQRYLTLGLTSSVSSKKRGTLMSLDVESRWAIRDQERTKIRRLSPQESILLSRSINNLSTQVNQVLANFQPGWDSTLRRLYIDDFKARYVTPDLNLMRTRYPLEVADSRLVDIIGRISLNPNRTLNFTGNANYDAVQEEFRSLSATAAWIPHERIRVNYLAVWLPATSLPDQELEVLNAGLIAIDPLLRIDTTVTIPDNWQHTFGVELIGNRYRLLTEATMRPQGELIDGFSAQITRRIVDGEVGLNYEIIRGTDGRITDQTISLTLTLFGFELF